MTDRLTQSELESYLWGAATILRGLVDAGDYKQYIFPLLSASHNCTSHLWEVLNCAWLPALCGSQSRAAPQMR